MRAGRVLPAARRRHCRGLCPLALTGSCLRSGGARVTQGSGAGEAAGPWNPRRRAATSSPTSPRWWSVSSASCPPRRCCAPPGKGGGRGVGGGRRPAPVGGGGAADAVCPCCVAACAGYGGSVPGGRCGRGSESRGCRRWSRAPPRTTRWCARWPASSR